MSSNIVDMPPLSEWRTHVSPDGTWKATFLVNRAQLEDFDAMSAMGAPYEHFRLYWSPSQFTRFITRSEKIEETGATNED